MYQIKYPIGLKQRLGFLSGNDRVLRLSLLKDGYNYASFCNTKKCFAFKNIPEKNTQNIISVLQKDSFCFLTKQDILCLKTMEITKYV